MHQSHIPVLRREVTELLAAAPPGPIIDCTFGAGGHTESLVAAGRSVVALDRDPDARSRVREMPGAVPLHVVNFADLAALAQSEGLDDVAGVLFDLGLSSLQLAASERGFSYRASGPLDMRMGPDAPHPASQLVNETPFEELTAIIRRFGEEPHAAAIAAAIVAARPLHGTTELAAVVAEAVPAAVRRRRHPARRTFQALRMAVNDEVGSLQRGLDAAIELLGPEGRVVVIAYHSIEDRVVAHRLAQGARGCVCPPDLPVCACGRTAELRLLTRRPLVPTDTEIAHNPRARSARLRAAEKVPQ